MLKAIFRVFVLVFLCGGFSYADVPIATDSRIRTYVYNPNDIYLVVVESGFQSSIELDKGENIQTLSLGDQYAWSLTPMGNRLFIKPLENNVRTNMTIITNMRTYQFDLVSADPGEGFEQAAYVIRFYYPPRQQR